MTITVLDTDTATREILTAPLADRPELLRRMLEPAAGMYKYFPGTPDLVQLHHQGSGFRVDRDVPEALAGLDALHEADAWHRIETGIHQALAAQLAATPDITVPDITVVLVLGNHEDQHFMDVALGMAAAGGTSGYIWIGLWPSAENLARLEATVAHELNHNLRYTTMPWNPATVDVAEFVVSEGLADAFARHVHGDLGYARIGLPSLGDDAVYEKVVAGLGLRGMQYFAPYVHGDLAAVRFGASPVGLPTGAGYAVGNRLVDAYLAANGLTAPDALLVSAADVVAASV